MSYLNSRVPNQPKLDSSYSEFLSASKISLNESNWQNNLRIKKIEKAKTNIQFELRKNRIKNETGRQSRINSSSSKVNTKRRTRVYSPIILQKRNDTKAVKPSNSIIIIQETSNEVPTIVNDEIFAFSTIENLEKPKESIIGETVNFKYYKLCDCCDGKCGNKLNPFKIIQDVYYTPLWFQLLITSFFIGFLASTLYLAISYTNNKNMLTYTDACTSTAQCNSDKNLFCRSNNVSTVDYCNCPAPSQINTCDCASTFYWNGLKCSSVYTYGKGPCVGDYSCSNGLTCNQQTSLCTCTNTMPLWDNSTCNYQYKGCFYDCLSSISCDFYQSNVLIATNQKSLNDTIIYSIELDDCLNLCKLKGYSYAHMHFSGTIYRCACSNSYNTYSTKMPDDDCNIPCSLYKSSISKCPTASRYSSFYIS